MNRVLSGFTLVLAFLITSCQSPFEKGKEYLAAGNYDQAVIQFKAAIADNPELAVQVNPKLAVAIIKRNQVKYEKTNKLKWLTGAIEEAEAAAGDAVDDELKASISGLQLSIAKHYYDKEKNSPTSEPTKTLEAIEEGLAKDPDNADLKAFRKEATSTYVGETWKRGMEVYEGALQDYKSKKTQPTAVVNLYVAEWYFRKCISLDHNVDEAKAKLSDIYTKTLGEFDSQTDFPIAIEDPKPVAGHTEYFMMTVYLVNNSNRRGDSGLPLEYKASNWTLYSADGKTYKADLAKGKEWYPKFTVESGIIEPTKNLAMVLLFKTDGNNKFEKLAYEDEIDPSQNAEKFFP